MVSKIAETRELQEPIYKVFIFGQLFFYVGILFLGKIMRIKCENTDLISSYFNPVAMWGVFKELLGDLIVLVGAFLISGLLEAALASHWDKALYIVGFGAIFLILAYALNSFFTEDLKLRYAQSSENWREELSRLTICGSIAIDSSGSYDGRAEDDTETIASFKGIYEPKAIGAVLTILITVGIIFYHDYRLALIFLTLSLLQLIPTFIYEKWTKRVYDETSDDEEAYADWIGEGFHGIRAIKSYNAEEWYTKRFESCNTSMIKSGIKAEGTGTLETMIGSLIESILSWGAYIIIGAFSIYKGLDILLLPLMILMSQKLFSAASTLVEAWTKAFEAKAAMERLEKRTKPRTKANIGEVAVFKDVSKSFDGKCVLSDVNLIVKSGDKIKLCGKNGSGKSTLLKLLLGFIFCDSGSISLKDLKVAYAFQEETILPCSGVELVEKVLSTKEADEVKLRANLSAFGVDKVLSHSLNELSGGERKKLFLSLALSKKSELLVLDEPSNHLDKESVPYLLEQLKADQGTQIICTHDDRLSLAWTKVIEVKEGKLYE